MMCLDLACQCMTEFLYRSVTAMLEDKAFAQGRVCHRELLTSAAGLKLLISHGELHRCSFPGRAHHSATGAYAQQAFR